MNLAIHPAAKALWYIENRFDEDISLEDIAAHAGVSRFHMTRVFDARMGLPVMTYVRARRLTEAARRLAMGAPDILTVALETGYQSHEAFTRAFRDQFGLTPEQVRNRRNLANLKLQEPFIMNKALIDTPSPHTLVKGSPMLIGGLSHHYRGEETAGIPMLWQKSLPGCRMCLAEQVNPIRHMVFAIIKMMTASTIWRAWRSSSVMICRLVSPRFALRHKPMSSFPTRGISQVCALPGQRYGTNGCPSQGSGVKQVPFFEKYGPEFDGTTGEGGLSIWIAIES